MRGRGGAALVLVPLALASLLILPRLGWGLQRDTGAFTYEPDEHHTIEAVRRMSLSPLRLDPGKRLWGGLSYPLHFATLTAGDALGAFPGGHATALEAGGEPARRVLVAVRLLPFACTLVLVLAAFLAAGGGARGLFAAALVAVSPAATFSGRSFTPDALAAALVACAFLPASPRARGLLAGLATGSKYSAGAFVPALLLRDRPRGVDVRSLFVVLLGAFLAAPFSFLHPIETARALVGNFLRVRKSVPGDFAPWGRAGWELVIAVLFLVGPIALALAGVGLAKRLRERTAREPLLALLGGAAWVVIGGFPVIRYQLPLVFFLAVLAAEALPERGAARAAAGALCLGPPAFLSLLFPFGVPEIHPFERAREVVEREAARLGRAPTVAHVWGTMPLLSHAASSSLHPFDAPPLLRFEPPGTDLVLEDDLPTLPFSPRWRALRDREYRAIAVFGGPPRLFGLTWPRALTPHDARYSSPSVTVLERRR